MDLTNGERNLIVSGLTSLLLDHQKSVQVNGRGVTEQEIFGVTEQEIKELRDKIRLG